MKYSTCIIVIGILFNSSLSNATDKKLNPYSQSGISSSFHINKNNFQKSFTPFFIEDFASGLPSGWQAVDSAGIGVNWHYTTTGTYNTFYDSLSVVGTSAANGYMIYDSDSANATFGGENADLISVAINCSSHSNVHLSFNEYLLHYNDTATLLVSNNGISWTLFHNSSAGLAQQSGTTNPHNVSIDISSVAANHDSVYIRFNYKADLSFFWMIDDVQLYEAPSNDGSIVNITTPVTGCTPLSSSELITVVVYNNGSDSISGGFDLTFIADNGIPVTENILQTIASGASFDYTFTATTDFSAPGNHSILTYINLPGDTILSNDTLFSTVYSGPYIINTINSYSNGFEASDDLSGFAIEDNNTDSISWNISNVSPNTGTYCANISSVTADDWYFTTCLELDSSFVYNLEYFYRTSSTSTQANFQVMIGFGQSSGSMTQEIVPFSLISNLFYLQNSVQFNVGNTGTYYLGLHVQNSDSLVGFSIDDLNISVDSGLGISSLTNNPFSVYPNPSSGIFNINLKENSPAGFKIEIIDQSGNLIFSKPTEKLHNYIIDLQEQPAGIYFLRIISENGIHTRKISIIH